MFHGARCKSQIMKNTNKLIISRKRHSFDVAVKQNYTLKVENRINRTVIPFKTILLNNEHGSRYNWRYRGIIILKS